MRLTIRLGVLVLFCSVAALGSAVAQPEAIPDTVKLVRIGDSLRVFSDTTTFFHPGAVVIGTRAAGRRSASTIQQIKLQAIEARDALSFSDVARMIPSAHVQTNSRGETLLYLRNSGERQLAVYFDGALLNIPWDNRIDLDLIPTSALAGVSVSKGSASSEFGPNLMGGAVNLMTRDLAGTGHFTEATLHLGSGNERLLEATHLGRSPSFSYLASIGFVKRDGFTLPADANLRFSQEDADLRTNTDLKRLNVLARGEYVFDSDLSISLAAMAVDAEKGIAPEGHKDPEQGGVRYWRYPDWKNRMLIATFGRASDPTRPVSFQTSAWVNQFRQRIVAYDSEAFRYPTEEEYDDDLTVGGRVVLTGDLEGVGIRFAAGATHAGHNQTDTEFQAPELQMPSLSGPEQRYSQVLLNSGLEVDYRTGRMVYSAGVNLDSRSVLRADVFPEPDGQIEFGTRAGLLYEVSGPLEFRASGGRRSRFPTLREQFSGALGRFVVNPELMSEEAWLAESSLRYTKAGLTLEATGFLTLTSNTIDQTVVVVDGVSKRQRVNLDGSRNIGAELGGSYRPLEHVWVSFDATISRLRAEGSQSAGFSRPMTERPENTGSVNVSYTHHSGGSAQLEAVYTGDAYSLGEDGDFVDLSSSTVINVRGAYRFRFARSTRGFAELFARVNNVGDVVVENQLGLPGPGRTALAGLKLSV